MPHAEQSAAPLHSVAQTQLPSCCACPRPLQVPESLNWHESPARPLSHSHDSKAEQEAPITHPVEPEQSVGQLRPTPSQAYRPH